MRIVRATYVQPKAVQPVQPNVIKTAQDVHTVFRSLPKLKPVTPGMRKEWKQYKQTLHSNLDADGQPIPDD